MSDNINDARRAAIVARVKSVARLRVAALTSSNALDELNRAWRNARGYTESDRAWFRAPLSAI